MARRMLVDATHAEETRVVVVNGNRLEEFDFETASKKQLKGNIYLARVTRVEPSLQAAFVEYGGNRHGFLAFSEIHPDYYRIPIADREALIEQDQAKSGDDAEDSDDEANGEDGADPVETVGGDDADEVVERRSTRPQRSYKIQEVIKRRQVMLVQVTKEERGNKGAALTTYLSLAGRYCVLMPNTPRGGGISRKIVNPAERKKMKSILEDLFVPPGMAVILRTAGVKRTKAEIKRDLDYLLRLWESIRERTLQSNAPSIIHEEANLIKRAIRDLYSRDLDEVLVEGEGGYKTAKDFMKMLMPSHARRVQTYKEDLIPLYHRYQVESQIEALHDSTVQLRSGGYIVINPTEALVAIDVNSGRSTRERNIEETAYKTNLEAADEVGRQLRLRDLAGLIVVDFIDMEEDRHNHAVERRLKEAMKSDRARIQLGRISPFGLLELSRQRLRPSLIEAHFEVSPYCGGTGMIRTTESSALLVLRAVVEEGIRKRSAGLTISVPTKVALYILNQKRAALAEIEARYGFDVAIEADDSLLVPGFRLERSRARPDSDAAAPVDADRVMSDVDAEASESDRDGERDGGAAKEDEGRGRRRRRSRRRRRDQDADGATQEQAAADQDGATPEDQPTEPSDGEAPAAPVAADDEDDDGQRRRRRGRRGGRSRSRRRSDEDRPAEVTEVAAGADGDASGEASSEPPATVDFFDADPRESDGRDDDPRDQAEDLPEPEHRAAPDQAEAEAEAKPKRPRRRRTRKTEAAPSAEDQLAESPAASAAPAEQDDTAPAEPAVAVEDPATPDGGGQPATEAAEEPKKPARQRRTRKPRARKEAAEVETADAEETVEQADGKAEGSNVRTIPIDVGGGDGASSVEAEAEAAPEQDEKPDTPASDGNGQVEEENQAVAAAQVVNKPPEKPRRGWWRRVVS
ncbi:MAG: Rne/Rng family ribonuclease [Pseudomonadota bacterium]